MNVKLEFVNIMYFLKIVDKRKVNVCMRVILILFMWKFVLCDIIIVLMCVNKLWLRIYFIFELLKNEMYCFLL